MDLTRSAPQDLHSETPIAMGGSNFHSLANIKLADASYNSSLNDSSTPLSNSEFNSSSNVVFSLLF